MEQGVFDASCPVSHQGAETGLCYISLTEFGKVNQESSCSKLPSRRSYALVCSAVELGLHSPCLSSVNSADMASFLKSKLKGSSKSTPPVSNQSSFSEATDDDFHDASEEVRCSTFLTSIVTPALSDVKSVRSAAISHLFSLQTFGRLLQQEISSPSTQGRHAYVMERIMK